VDRRHWLEGLSAPLPDLCRPALLPSCPSRRLRDDCLFRILPVSYSLLSRRRGGFTLVELLVVIGIIALLIGILLPTLQRARVAGQSVVCANNLRQLGIGINQYADDHRNWYPQSSHDHLHGLVPPTSLTGDPLELRSWIHRMRPYIAEVDEIRVCPAHPAADEMLETEPVILSDGTSAEIGFGTSYLFNYYLVSEYQVQPSGSLVPVTLADWRRRNSLENPVETKVLLESNVTPGKADEDFDHTDAESWFTSMDDEANWEEINKQIAPDRHTTDRSEQRDVGRANYLFADTHVAPVQASEIRGKVVDRIDFSMPPNDVVSPVK
jgi:prepilin-type N-terminal cleavage/methylation domain-containing protein/prepilin-type processing-associated H-X9-DG protein